MRSLILSHWSSSYIRLRCGRTLEQRFYSFNLQSTWGTKRSKKLVKNVFSNFCHSENNFRFYSHFRSRCLVLGRKLILGTLLQFNIPFSWTFKPHYPDSAPAPSHKHYHKISTSSPCCLVSFPPQFWPGTKATKQLPLTDLILNNTYMCKAGLCDSFCLGWVISVICIWLTYTPVVGASFETLANNHDPNVAASLLVSFGIDCSILTHGFISWLASWRWLSTAIKIWG